MLKDRLSKTSGRQFHRWLFGPGKFSGLSRNGPLVVTPLVAIMKDQVEEMNRLGLKAFGIGLGDDRSERDLLSSTSDHRSPRLTVCR